MMKYRGKNIIRSKKTPIPQPQAFIPLFEASFPIKIATTSTINIPSSCIILCFSYFHVQKKYQIDLLFYLLYLLIVLQET